MDVPEWSGQFWTDAEGGEGYVEYHAADTRSHPAPDPKVWKLILMDHTIEGERFVYRRR